MTSLTIRKQADEQGAAEPAAILHWVFQRGSKALTCEVRTSGRQVYEVCVVPHWDVSSSVVEAFDRPLSAIRRHAELAFCLRQAGWVLYRQDSHHDADLAA